MDATLDLVTKVVYQEGVGLSIKHGDDVTMSYSGIWFSAESETSGVQFFPTYGESRISFCVGDPQESPCKELEALLCECEGGMKEGEISGFTMPHSNANLFGYEVPGDADVRW
ncbi:hypothetical protein WHR41_09298 [Cladosporium halotolerans]|uniref:Peptidylprolyl isomerase n=1 Tax=Cladosporium halotolerans TaxID=1052096 RepID=A0AB34KBW9_9PEZI